MCQALCIYALNFQLLFNQPSKMDPVRTVYLESRQVKVSQVQVFSRGQERTTHRCFFENYYTQDKDSHLVAEDRKIDKSIRLETARFTGVIYRFSWVRNVCKDRDVCPAQWFSDTDLHRETIANVYMRIGLCSGMHILSEYCMSLCVIV